MPVWQLLKLKNIRLQICSALFLLHSALLLTVERHSRGNQCSSLLSKLSKTVWKEDKSLGLIWQCGVGKLNTCLAFKSQLVFFLSVFLQDFRNKDNFVHVQLHLMEGKNVVIKSFAV